MSANTHIQECIRLTKNGLDGLNYDIAQGGLSLPPDIVKRFGELRDLFQQQQENISASDAAELVTLISSFPQKGTLGFGGPLLETLLKNPVGKRASDLKKANEIINSSAVVYGCLPSLMSEARKSAEYDKLLSSNNTARTP